MKAFAKELDVYAGIAIIFVVLIHANAFFLTEILSVKKYTEAGLLLTLVDQIVHVAVPMFIFIAGFKYQLSNKKDSYKLFVKKRLAKVIVPFLIVSCVFILADGIHSYFAETASITGLLSNALVNFAKIFFGYNIAYQLWYIPMYLFVVLTYPLVTRYLRKQITRFVLFGAVSTVYILLSSFTDVFRGYAYPFSFVYYFVFFELGCYVGSTNKLVPSKQNMLFLSYLLVLVTSVFTASSNFDSVITDLFFTPLSVVAFYYVSRLVKENRTLASLGRYSFYIFLLHEPLFVTGLSDLIKRSGWYAGYPITLLVSVVAILVSIGLYKILAITGFSNLIFAEKKEKVQAQVAQ